ncbi:methylmalonyl-CoA/ethylmalonyl-CoA epimerase [Fonticula alba]|uniref:Methylmalonyl-CoA epimerase, mitochondrial n=1 Tax=Fonticula alba TaxID=691883 RepID=A0A058Z0K1_FONAL|nr:methylmalonyl-CoA/ethylmalonyl-CoA epimerase [Fonticula alba]KCV67785.1 methylmalonyl-CoA/ethylmalonyl-CoA epimerase [Fonticula alba]|eukprot:XP_009497816.1 methylmalonyl-CoA/ethylmalonyl-CoA epimerase [Fonticula alba]
MLRSVSAFSTARSAARAVFAAPRAATAVRAFSASTPPASEEGVRDSPVWQLGKINHIAIAVPNLKDTSFFYRDILRASHVSEEQNLPEHGVTTVFIHPGQDKSQTLIELLHPYPADSTTSPISSFLARNPQGGIHHVCLEVNDIQAACASLREKGIRLLYDAPKIGAHGKPVMFIHPKDCNGVLVELEQE